MKDGVRGDGWLIIGACHGERVHAAERSRCTELDEDIFAGTLSRHEILKISLEEAEAIANEVDAFVEALRLATDPVTRTAPLIARKNAARLRAEQIIRPVYGRIRLDRTLPIEDKVDIGVRLTAHRSRITTPHSAPRLSVVGAPWEFHKLRASELGETGNPHSKPRGAAQWQLFRGIADGPTDQLEYFISSSRKTLTIRLNPNQNGKVATYRARWVTARGLTGPWGPAISVPILTGGAVGVRAAG